MNKQEYLLNRPLLKEINEKKKDDSTQREALSEYQRI